MMRLEKLHKETPINTQVSLNYKEHYISFEETNKLSEHEMNSHPFNEFEQTELLCRNQLFFSPVPNEHPESQRVLA